MGAEQTEEHDEGVRRDQYMAGRTRDAQRTDPGNGSTGCMSISRLVDAKSRHLARSGHNETRTVAASSRFAPSKKRELLANGEHLTSGLR
jgi:hypothetical protein